MDTKKDQFPYPTYWLLRLPVPTLTKSSINHKDLHSQHCNQLTLFQMKNFSDMAKALGVQSTCIYYTTRELSNRCMNAYLLQS